MEFRYATRRDLLCRGDLDRGGWQRTHCPSQEVARWPMASCKGNAARTHRTSKPTVRDRSADVAGRLAPLASSARNTLRTRRSRRGGWPATRVGGAAQGLGRRDPRLIEATNSAVVASKPVRDEAMARGTVGGCGTQRRAGGDRQAEAAPPGAQHPRLPGSGGRRRRRSPGQKPVARGRRAVLRHPRPLPRNRSSTDSDISTDTGPTPA